MAADIYFDCHRPDGAVRRRNLVGEDKAAGTAGWVNRVCLKHPPSAFNDGLAELPIDQGTGHVELATGPLKCDFGAVG